MGSQTPENRRTTRSTRSTRAVPQSQQTSGTNKKSRGKTAVNALLMTVVIAGAGLLGYSGYLYFDDKAQVNAATAEADAILDVREETPVEQAPTLLDNWKQKEAFMPDVKRGAVIGKLLIPKLKGELPIVEGVGADDLSKGVGHDHDTLLPLDNGQIVLSGHRDTVFRGIGELKEGDTFVMQLPYGDFEYKLTRTKIVKANDRTIIVPHDTETLTVTTCYPFNFVGHAPDRYIMYAEPTFDMSELHAASVYQDAK